MDGLVLVTPLDAANRCPKADGLVELLAALAVIGCVPGSRGGARAGRNRSGGGRSSIKKLPAYRHHEADSPNRSPEPYISNVFARRLAVVGVIRTLR